MTTFKVFESDAAKYERLDLEGRKITEMPPGVPDRVHSLTVKHTLLQTLAGGPKHVNGIVNVSDNADLKSLEGGPTEVGHGYYAHSNGLVSLRGAPREVNGAFSCHKCQLTTLAGAPLRVAKSFHASSNPLTTLEGIGHEYLTHVGGRLELSETIERAALGLFLVDCKHFALPFPGGHVIQLYLERSTDLSERKKQMIECQHHLIDLGYEDLAEL